MDFSFLCNPAIAMKQYGLMIGLIAITAMGISAYFQKGAALMTLFGGIVLAVVILMNLSTIATWMKLPLTCAGL